MTTAPASRSQPTTASERDQIVARLADLQAKQEAATGWGAAVGAREEEIRSLESRLLRIDAMTAPPSTETPRHTATPWILDGTSVYYLDWDGVSYEGKGKNYQQQLTNRFWFSLQGSPKRIPKEELEANAAFIVRAVNNHAALTAKVAELTQMLKSASSQCGNVIYNCEQRPADNQRHLDSWKGVKQFIDAALDNTDGGRES